MFRLSEVPSWYLVIALVERPKIDSQKSKQSPNRFSF